MGDTVIIPSADDVGNILIDAASVTPSSEDADFAKEYLIDGEIGPLFKFAAAAANDNVVFDLDRLHGGFEDWGASDPLPPNWVDDSSGTGAIARETTTVNAGGSTVAAKLTGGGAGNEARLRRTIQMMAGWAATVSLAIRGDGTNAVSIYIVNRETGAYLLSNETWSTTKTAYATRSTASYGAEGTPASFTIEASSVGLRGVYTFDIWAEQTSGSGYVDDFYLWPHWDFAAVFNHNLGANITARVRSDDNASMSSATNRVAFALRRPAMFGTPGATVTERYAQFYDEGTNPVPGEKGEVLLAQKLTLPRSINVPYDLTPDAGIVGDALRPRSFRRDESMTFPVSLRMTQTNWDNLRVQLFQPLRWGGARAVLVPDDGATDIYYGTLKPGRVSREQAGSIYVLDGVFVELGYGVKTT